MILVKNYSKIGRFEAFLPMLYRTNKHLWQGEHLCPNNKTLRIATANLLNFPYRFLPAPTATAPISVALMSVIYRWLNGWVKTKQFADCTVEPVARVSASARARLCSAPNYSKPTWCGLSNASAMVAPSKQRLTSAGGPTHPGNGVPIGGLGGDVFDNNKFASVVDRRSSAVSSGDSEGFWPSQASSPSKGMGEKTSSEAQATAEFAGRCSQKASRPAKFGRFSSMSFIRSISATSNVRSGPSSATAS